MTSNPSPAATGMAASWPRTRAWLGLLVLLAGLCLLPTTARAQSCWVSGAATLNFGTVTAAGNTDAQTNIALNCQASFNAPFGLAARFRVCVFVGEGNPTGMEPRRMTNYNGAFMNYDLYSNAARTQLIGPLGSTYPLYSLAFDVQESRTYLAQVPLYGRVPAGQNLPAAFPFQGFPANAIVRYSYGYLITPSEADCRNGVAGFGGGAGDAAFGWSGVYATFANTCRVVVATDLDFGSAGTLSANRDQTSTIQLQCPNGTAWRVNLDNGVNAAGNIRRMASGANRITYELYRDAARQNRWGNATNNGINGTGTNAAQSLTVYGRVPAQGNVPGGTYSDTITVTLTY